PEKEPERKDCLDIEKIADEEMAPAVRRVAYEALFEDKVAFARLMLPRKGLVCLLNPLRSHVIMSMLKWHFGITRKRLTSDKFSLDRLLTELQSRLHGRPYFVGSSLTIADIAVASLMNPLEIVEDFSIADDYSA